MGYTDETLPKTKEKEEWGNVYVVWSKFEMGNWNGSTVGFVVHDLGGMFKQ